MAVVGVAGLGGIALLANPAFARTSDPQAVAALERAATAAHALSYGGVQYVSTYSSAGSSSVILDVQHMAGRGSVVTVASSSGDRTSVYASDAPLPGTSDLAVAGVDGAALRLLQQTYDLELEGPSCVVARLPDGRAAGRFWLDPTSGLVVRREVYDAGGRVARASAFVDLRLTTPKVAVAARSLVAEVAERRLGQDELTRLASDGWTVPRVLPGQLLLYDARMDDGASPVVHLGYSDGLSTVSVFEQRGRLDKAAVRGWTKHKVDGADVWWDASAVPTRAVWSAHGRVWTVVADASSEAVRAVVSRLPHEKPEHRGFWSRIGHGLARLLSWLNPFD
jgi:sigma-E factor negative regulatory protein RseB